MFSPIYLYICAAWWSNGTINKIYNVSTLGDFKPFSKIPNSLRETSIFQNYVSWKYKEIQCFWARSAVFPWNIILENRSFSKSIWNFWKRFEVTRVNTLNILFIVPLDHQAAHIYRYMGLNIPYILGVFGLKNMFYFTKT